MSEKSCDIVQLSCDIQVTIQLAKEKHPRKVLGIDIDQKLIKMAWKNLHRYCIHGLTLRLATRRYHLSLSPSPGVTPHPSPLMADHSHLPSLSAGVLWTFLQPSPLQQVRTSSGCGYVLIITHPLSLGPGCTVAAQDRGSGSAPQTRPFPHNVQFMHVSPTWTHRNEAVHLWGLASVGPGGWG